MTLFDLFSVVIIIIILRLLYLYVTDNDKNLSPKEKVRAFIYLLAALGTMYLTYGYLYPFLAQFDWIFVILLLGAIFVVGCIALQITFLVGYLIYQGIAAIVRAICK